MGAEPWRRLLELMAIKLAMNQTVRKSAASSQRLEQLGHDAMSQGSSRDVAI